MNRTTDIFNMIQSADYKKVGLDLDYSVRISEEEKIIYLVFQPSVSKMDWRLNFTFPVKMYKRQENCFYVHSGWKKAWKSGNDVIMNEYINACNSKPEYKTAVCGWSYGGAVSLFACEDYFYRTKKQIDELITFGAPKPLFGSKSKKYFKTAVRDFVQYAHMNDIVVSCPPLPFYYNFGNTRLQKSNWWKFWRYFNPNKWHCCYADSSIYN